MELVAVAEIFVIFVMIVAFVTLLTLLSGGLRPFEDVERERFENAWRQEFPESHGVEYITDEYPELEDMTDELDDDLDGDLEKAFALTFNDVVDEEFDSEKRVTYHVVPSSDPKGWIVKKSKTDDEDFYRTKKEAVAAGRAIARSFKKGQLIIHRKDGTIQTEYTYGDDPRKTRG